MNLNHKTDYQTGDQLTATAWNNLAADVNELGASGVGGGVVSTEVDAEDANKTFVKVGTVTVAELTSKGDKGTNVGLSGDNNINIEPRPAAGDGSGKNTPGLANRKGGNIALKPGDDIEFWAHKRGTSKSDEVSVKMLTEVPKASDPTKTDEVAAKLQLNTADIVLTSKDKQSDTDVMNITVNKAANTRGYLKVRAQAIDLRCEDHGGIALQPKGQDGQGNMNKIKFEHGGGDGLEFGTFNTEHTSLFTNDYRFNKNGVIKLATRTTTESDKADANDPTTALKYVKQQDDFYDVISQDDPTCTWNNVVDVCSKLKNRVDFPTACYIVPVVPVPNNNSVITEDDGPVTTTVGGTYCTISGNSQSISYNYDSTYVVNNIPNLLSPEQIQSFEETPERLGTGQPAAVITKYVRSSELEEVFGLGTGVLNNTVATFLEEYYQNGHAIFKDTNNNLYCLVGSNDKCDLEFWFNDFGNFGNRSYRLYMKDIYNLIQHMKSNGLWS